MKIDEPSKQVQDKTPLNGKNMEQQQLSSLEEAINWGPVVRAKKAFIKQQIKGHE